MPIAEDLKVFSGNAHPQLARDICAYLDIQPGQIDVSSSRTTTSS